MLFHEMHVLPAYLDKRNIWVVLGNLGEFWVQSFAGLTPWSKKLDNNQLSSSFAVLNHFVKHISRHSKHHIFWPFHFPPAEICQSSTTTFAYAVQLKNCCAPAVGSCSSCLHSSCLSPTRRSRPSARQKYVANAIRQRIPVFSFLSPPDSIWMHTDTVVHKI